MSTDIILPVGGECVYRASTRSWLTERWRSLGYNVIEGYCEGTWSKAVAVADALTRSTAEVIVVHDADSWSAATESAIVAVEQSADWSVPFAMVNRMTEAASQAVLDGAPFSGAKLLKSHRMVPGGGITALTRELYERVPLDPRFKGWGYEDECWGVALRLTAGSPAIHQEHLWHFWHPPADRHPHKSESLNLRNLYMRARRRPAEMRTLLEGIPR